MVNVGKRHGVRNADSTLVLLLEDNIWGLFVDPNAKAFELRLDDSLVCERFVDIQDDEDQIAGLGHSNDLSTTTFSVFGTLNDTG